MPSHEEIRAAARAAYGLLWLFQGDSGTDPNAKLAHEARKRLRDSLSREDLSFGIVEAKRVTSGWKLSIEGWM